LRPPLLFLGSPYFSFSQLIREYFLSPRRELHGFGHFLLIIEKLLFFFFFPCYRVFPGWNQTWPPPPLDAHFFQGDCFLFLFFSRQRRVLFSDFHFFPPPPPPLWQKNLIFFFFFFFFPSWDHDGERVLAYFSFPPCFTRLFFLDMGDTW